MTGSSGRGQLKCDGTHAETKFRLSAKRTSPFKLAGESVQSTTNSRVAPISGSNAGHTMFRGSVKGTGYPFHSPVSPSLPLPCVTVCHHTLNGVYFPAFGTRWGRKVSSRSQALFLRGKSPGTHCRESFVDATSGVGVTEKRNILAVAWKRIPVPRLTSQQNSYYTDSSTPAFLIQKT